MFKITMQVRDYECDLQGVVNNAVYQHYLEHGRHQFLHAHQIDFAALAREGIDLMITEIAIQYKAPLRPNETFEVTVALKKSGRLRYVFEQQVLRAGQVCVQATATGVAVFPNGRPKPLEALEAIVP